MDFETLFKGLRGRWLEVSPEKRRAVVVLGASVLAALVFFFQWLGRPSYVPLYTGLEAQDAAAVVSALKEMRADYRLTGEGRTVLVPQKQVYELRLELAGRGLTPSTGGPGWELFDQTKLGSSDFQRQVDYQRALQEELRRSIVQFDEVDQARVHIVMPQPSVFVREEQSATASVVVRLKPGAKLKTDQVRAIVYLVSGSVPTLPPENIKVLNSAMQVLSDDLVPGQDNLAGALSQQEIKRTLQKDLESRIQVMLERILGPNQAVAMVSAELDFSERETAVTTFGREGSVRSEQVEEEQSEGQAALPPAGDANRQSPPVYTGTVPGGDSLYSRNSQIRNYELDTQVEKTTYAPGSVRRFSASVVVNGLLSDQQVSQIREIVSSAIGYQPDRGDSITVTSMAFDTSYEERIRAELAAAERRAQQQENLDRYIQWATRGGVLVLVIVFLLVLMRVRSRFGELASEITGSPVLVQPHTEGVTESLIPVEELERREKVERLRSITRGQPEEAAQLIKTWLSED